MVIIDGIINNKFGYCEYSFEEDYAHIYNLFVYPEFRKSGNARTILRMAINEIRAVHKGSIRIVANPKDEFVDKDRLISFYKSMGLDVCDYYE